MSNGRAPLVEAIRGRPEWSRVPGRSEAVLLEEPRIRIAERPDPASERPFRSEITGRVIMAHPTAAEAIVHAQRLLVDIRAGRWIEEELLP